MDSEGNVMRAIARILIGTAAALALPIAALAQAPSAAAPATHEITVFKSSSCHCCNKWIEHLRKSGFRVRGVNIEAMDAVRARFGVPLKMRACHTAFIDGYVIEGHVPAADILRLLTERPKIAGLAVPGMPRGSPGMEGPKIEAYSVMSFMKNGESAVFAKH